jgi:hypothetical protein
MRSEVPSLDFELPVLHSGTMAKHGDTLEQIRRLNPGLHWKRVETYLKHLGAEVHEGSGSTVTCVLEGRKLTADRPHPRRACGLGLVKRVRNFLDSIGHL